MNIKFDPIDMMVKSKGEKEKTAVIKLFDKENNKEYKIHIWIWECCFIATDDNEKYCCHGFKVKARCYNKDHKFKIIRSSIEVTDLLDAGIIDPVLLDTPFGNFMIGPYNRIIETEDGDNIVDTAEGYFSIVSVW